MKPLLAVILAAASAAAQEPAKPAADPKEPAEKAEAKAETKAPAAEAPAAEGRYSASIDIGYRWVSGPGGSVPTYRSVVNLGDGPKIPSIDLRAEPASRWLDRISITGSSWGGDPYNTARLNAEKQGLWRATADYRNILFFNALPSDADPALERGLLFNQRSYDMRRRYFDFEFELFPGKRISPYFGFTRESGFGTEILPFQTNGNEYPAVSGLDDRNNEFRGGVRFDFRRLNVTIEQGGVSFADNQGIVNANPGQGNRATPVFDRRLFLSRLNQVYAATGDTIFSKALVTASPTDWLHLYGRFVYARNRTDTTYSQDAQGLLLADAVRFASGLNGAYGSLARQPRTAGSFSAELLPVARLRIVETLMTDRFHNATSFRAQEQIVLLAGGNLTAARLFDDRMVVNYNRQQMEAIYDITKRITIRGGHRYLWGDARTRSPQLSPSPFGQGKFDQNVGLAGVRVRFTDRVDFNSDYEGARGGSAYFRTSLRDYDRLRLRGRVQPKQKLMLTAQASLLDNRNAAAGSNYEYRSRSASIAALWTPSPRAQFNVEYGRSALISRIGFLEPFPLDRQISVYRDDANFATATGEFEGPVAAAKRRVRFSAGGALVVSGGTRAARYYQPLGSVAVPVAKLLDWYAEWRWHGYTQPAFFYEGFRAHLLMTGLRWRPGR
ncbi:MAG: hypothetical protein U0Q16_21035 [Bryobacteraceae bacterium]